MTQKVFFGFGATTRLRCVLDRMHARRVFLVTGRDSFVTSGAADVVGRELEGREVQRHCGFSENPKLEDVMAGISALRSNDYDVVVAVGGGSVMDMAKLVNTLAYQDDTPQRVIEQSSPIRRGGLPLVAIPTTSGSGSEATHFGVVYVNQSKHSVAHASMLPETAIVDPSLTMRLPPRLTAVTGMDTLAQAIESFWCIHATEQSKAFARRAIRLVLDYLVAAVKAPTARARRGMSKASHFAGRAINISKTTGAHALSYAFTIRFGVPHGHAVSLTLGEFFVFNRAVSDRDVTDARGAGYVRATIDELVQMMGCRDASDCRRLIRDLMTSIGLETSLSALGVSRQDAVDGVVRDVNMERLANNPRAMSPDQLTQLVAAAC